jgi:pimeloyl-ACP methyl ester carboxylesterase
VAIEKINGVNLFIEDFGSGDPIVLVHGSWVDHMDWPFVVPQLAPRFRVTVYDRRGHSQSERPQSQGSITEDVADLAAVIERAGVPAHIIANSLGGSISLRLAAERPDIVRTVAVHEPPLMRLLLDDPVTKPMADNLLSFFSGVSDAIADGRNEDGARQFVGAVVGPDAWDTMLPEEAKRTLINNAPTFLDEMRDPDIFGIDSETLARFSGPVLLSEGSESPPFLGQILDRVHAALPTATRHTFAGAGHIPHITHPQDYVTKITEFIDSAAA